MDSGWMCIYASDQPHRVEIAKAVLKDNNIESVEINKRDSTYITVGEVELYVKNEDAALARIIIQQNEL